MELLEEPGRSVVVDLTGIDLAERPRVFAELIPELSKLRSQTARPHWLLIDEAHHLLPSELGTAALSLPRDLAASIVVTGHPDQLALPVLEAVRLVLTVGANAAATMRAFCQRTGDATPRFDATLLERDEAWLWDRRSAGARRVRMIRPHARRSPERWLGN
jgi:hypothetical protein